MPTVNPSKENTQKGNTPRGKNALGPSASVSENIKDGLYVDSCDMAELAPGRHPITEVKAPAGRKADPQHSSPVLDGECILAEYSTLAEFTFGLPRYHIAFTSHRIILKQKCRFLGLCGKESEQFICYRDLVNVSIGGGAWLLQLQISISIALAGLLLFALLMIAKATGSAIAVCVVSLASSSSLLIHYLAMDHAIEGVDLIIEACKVGKLVPSWPCRTNNQSAKCFYMRLPADQAYAAMKLLLGHSEFGLLSSSIAV